MKAAVLHELGQVPVCEDFAEPQADAGEQIVRVRAAALKQLERAIAAGTHYSSPRTLPIVPGVDGVGTLHDGRRVYFMARRRPFGAMAERAPAALTVPVPDGVDDVLAAAIVNPALAAWLPLRERAGMKAGESVLVMGATGTSGSLAVRAARLFGASRVVACGRRTDVLQSLGADETVDLGLPPDALARRFAQVAHDGIDVVVDYLWGPPALALIEALVQPNLHAAGGSETRYVSVGAMAGPTIAFPSAALRGARLHVLGSGTGNFPDDARLAGVITEIFRTTAERGLSVPTAAHALRDVAAAWSAEAADVRPVFVID